MNRWSTALALWLLMSSAVHAESRELEFVQGLRDHGLADIAVLHLTELENRQAISGELEETFDLEFARSLIADAETTPNVDRAAQDLVQARQRLERFLQAHADHPAAALAWRSSGEISLRRGERILKGVERHKDENRRAAERERARAEFEQARPAFQKAVDLFGARVQALRSAPPAAAPKSRPARRLAQKEASDFDLAEEDWYGARHLAAAVDYFVGVSIADPADPQRMETLRRAAKGFDAIFQARRLELRGSQLVFGGLVDHFWQARALEALGELQTALDVYQEVLAAAPEPNERSVDDQLPFFAEAKQREIALLQGLHKDELALSEAETWVDRWQGAKRVAENQAIALELARMLAERAQSLEPQAAERLTTRALSILAELAKTPGPLQTEAIRRRWELAKKIGRTLEITTFADAAAMGEAALESGDWPAAVELYGQALDLGDDVRPVQRVDEARYRRAYAQLMTGDAAGAFDSANALARVEPPRDNSPQAAVLALNAALNLAAGGKDKEVARRRLSETADFIRSTWPRRAEADEASLALGKLELVEGRYPQAIAIFESLPSSSQRYGLGQWDAAVTRWRVLQQQTASGQVRGEEREEQRNAIMAQLQLSVQRQEEALGAGETPPATLNEARALLAEILQDAGRTDEAVALYEPMVREALQQTSGNLSVATRTMLTAATYAYLQTNRLEPAREIAGMLADRGEDVAGVNSVLLNFAVALRGECRTLEARAQSAAEDADALAAAQAQIQTAHDALVRFVERLAAREHLNLRERILVGDLGGEIGLSDLARAQYQRALALAESTPQASAQNKAALIRVRAQLVGLLRNAGQYEQALAEAERLVEEAPRALEPRMERARILQALAETDPSRYPAAVEAWTALRLAMPKSGKKPPEYYEVVYYAAAALAGQAAAATDRAAADESRKQAETLLKTTLLLAPDLSGPEMVERYRALLERVSS